MTTTDDIKKRAKLRHNEYYDMQDVFDELYAKSQNGCIFRNLVEIIMSEANIKLAYRNIKNNTGSNTAGVDKITISDIEKWETSKLVAYIRNRIRNYIPQPVRRVEIPKIGTDKTRPLGIPTIGDRLVQQCILQVLEPICEAKFYHHSYGFRPNRSAHDAIAIAMYRIQKTNLHYAIDIDLKSFFDNVNHSKLIKQIWSIGIRDKNLICIISKMLRAEVQNFGIPKKGTPQGGILSPLLSNIVLNELDWWVYSQWEGLKTHNNYAAQSNKTRALKRSTNLKEMYIVRYADDFKIFCRDYPTAVKTFAATIKWLKERLDLEINQEKSGITNLRRKYTEFLGLKLKATPKRKKHVVRSEMTDKAIHKSIHKLKEAIDAIKNSTTTANANRYNATVLGLHNYYKVATHVSVNFGKIAFPVNGYLYNRLKSLLSKNGMKSKTYQQLYGSYNYKTYTIAKITLFPIAGIKTAPPMIFSREKCNYSVLGRKLIHDGLRDINPEILRFIMRNPIQGQSAKFNDNRISLFVGQNGKCRITKQQLQIGKMETHHIIPKSQGGTDEYENLVMITMECHELIHATIDETIKKYMDILKPNKNALGLINEYRRKVGNCIIS